MKTYSIGLIGLEQRRTVVFGGGPVAARKAAGLLAAGARVTVISPALSAEMQAWADAGAVTVVERVYQPGDLRGVFLAVAATDDPVANQAIWQEANAEHCLVNVVDQPALSHFIVPAVVRRGEISVTVSTGGASPALTRHLRETLESVIGPEYGDLAELLAELRPELIEHYPASEARLAAVRQLIEAGVLDIIRREGRAAGRQFAQQALLTR